MTTELHTTEPESTKPPSAETATVVSAPIAHVSRVLEPGAHPLPDYELIDLLGRGGFGEVWKAIGPGGFPVALKFVRLDQAAGEVELRSLDVIKNVHHAHLLGTFGAWIQQDQLIVAMELGDQTLKDCLHQSQVKGLPGIPVAELREYMMDVARGLDHLNALGIQHRDVKPQNLLLVGGTVKVADFGLVKLLEHSLSSSSGSMTPAYASPELLDGKTSSHSDQYSLAVTYCHLRGGRLPFEGNPAHIMAGHLMERPGLTMLPENERAVVARALAKNPDERWPSCRDFVEALVCAMDGADRAETKTLPPKPRPISAQPGRRRWLVPALVLVAMLLLSGGVALFYVLRDVREPAIHVHTSDSVAVEANHSTTLIVEIERIRCPGSVEVSLQDLPPGVSASPVTVDAEESRAKVTLQVRGDAAAASQVVHVRACQGPVCGIQPVSLTIPLASRPPVDTGTVIPPRRRVRDIYQETLRGTALVRTKSGSGTAWLADRKNRLVISNHHVIQSADSVRILFPAQKDGKLVVQRRDYGDAPGVFGKVIDTDSERDLALIQVEQVPEEARELPLAPESAGPGDRVHSIGNPGASDALWLYTTGTVRQVYRKEWSYRVGKRPVHYAAYVLETQSGTNKGDSGGPVVNDRGELVGVVSGGIRFDRQGNPVQLIDWSIDVREVRRVLDRSRILLDPKSADDFVARGSRLAQRYRYVDAISDFTTALKLDPNSAAAYRERGLAFFFKGDHDTAIADFTQALKMNPIDAVALQNRGRIYRRKGQNDQAVEDFTRAIQIDPKYCVAYNNRGVVYLDKGERSRALADFNRSLECDPQNAMSYLNRGDVYHGFGEHDRAIREYLQAVQIHGDAMTFARLARACVDKKAYEDALLYCNNSLKFIDPDYAPTYLARGLAYAGRKELDAARADYDQAIKLDPKLASAYFERGALFEELNDGTRAQADYDQAVRLDSKRYGERVKTQTQRYLRVVNNTGEPLRVRLFYESRNDKGEWQWHPGDPPGGKHLYVDVAPGKSTFVYHENEKVNGRRVRIWAESTSTKSVWHRDKDQDVWLCAESYRTQKEMMFTYTFNKAQ